MDGLVVTKGAPTPLGVTIEDKKVNFALFSEHGKKVTLVLLDKTSKKIIFKYELSSALNKTGFVWHLAIDHLELPVLYAYQIDGSHHSPNFYDPSALLCDPYAKILQGPRVWGENHHKYHPFGVVMDLPKFNWEHVEPPRHCMKDLIIYEMHVRGFTQDSSSKVKHPGTYLGVIEKIPYLLELGVNAIELMPIHEFNECSNHRKNPMTQDPLYNYWGYSSLNFFSPMLRYSSSDELAAAILEFKGMVKELHRNKIEVILDVVFNHTGEKKQEGNFLSFLGIDRSSYYLLHQGEHTNYTGCGNTVNVNHLAALQLILDSLRYFVTQMHIDGFRFDLAAIFNRNETGHLEAMSFLTKAISEDPILANTKLIAEPWDAAGAYQLGGFCPTKNRWSEWNGKFRDDVRRFIKGDPFVKNDFAHRICGSESLFHQRSPQASLNFITAHDGYTLHDLVSYQKKHNFENGEGNRDGSDCNFSWNHGVEGKALEEKIIHLRNRQMKNFYVALLISSGVPMLLMGDEYGHTKKGNNNTWCQDGKINYFLWDELESNKGFFLFIQKMIAFRASHKIFKREKFFKEEITWHGSVPNHPNWEDPKALLAFSLFDKKEKCEIFIAFNATADPTLMTLPTAHNHQRWRLIVDTYASSPGDFLEPADEREITSKSYNLEGYSVIILKSF